jgi:hypothetical protein
MGNKNSVFYPCLNQEIHSSRNGIEEFGFSSGGPIKIVRKKCSIATSETISINPVPLQSNRSSVTEFIVNGSESIESIAKSPNMIKKNVKSAISSPSRSRCLEPYDLFLRNSRKDGVNLVPKVRARSLVTSPKRSLNSIATPGKSIERVWDQRLHGSSLNNSLNEHLNKIKQLNTSCFEHVNLKKAIKKRYYN